MRTVSFEEPVVSQLGVPHVLERGRGKPCGRARWLSLCAVSRRLLIQSCLLPTGGGRTARTCGRSYARARGAAWFLLLAGADWSARAATTASSLIATVAGSLKMQVSAEPVSTLSSPSRASVAGPWMFPERVSFAALLWGHSRFYQTSQAEIRKTWPLLDVC